MNLVVIVVLAIAFRFGFDFFASQTGGKIAGVLSNTIISLTAAILPLLIFAFVNKSDGLPTTKEGVTYSVLAGASVGMFTVFLIKAFESGRGLAYLSPLVYGSVVLLSVIFGAMVLKESVNAAQILGSLLIVSGVLLIAIKA